MLVCLVWLTSRFANGLFYLLAITGLVGSFSDRVLSFVIVSQLFDIRSVWQSFSLVGRIIGGCELSFGCLVSNCAFSSNCILLVVSFISEGV